MAKKKVESWPTASTVAKALGCSRQHVYKLEKRGELEGRDVRTGGVKIRRFNPEHVRRFSESSLQMALRPTAKEKAHSGGMMTRMQVARALGRSIATVRRTEGTILHPRLDASGVWRFDRRKVDQLAAEIRAGRSLLGGFPLSSVPVSRRLQPNTIQLCKSCARRAAAALGPR